MGAGKLAKEQVCLGPQQASMGKTKAPEDAREGGKALRGVRAPGSIPKLGV